MKLSVILMCSLVLPLAARAQDDAPPVIHKAKPRADKPGEKVAAKPASKPFSKPAAAGVPPAPPPPPTLPPPLVVPTRAATPPIPAVVVADAPGEPAAQKDGLRVTFGPGRSDLNPRTDAAIRALVHAAPPFATTTFSIVAVAPGTEEDPSAPRRLSLARALAIRSILITEGIPSTRIYVHAMGANAQAIAGGPADRADIAVGGTIPAAKQGQAS